MYQPVGFQVNGIFTSSPLRSGPDPVVTSPADYSKSSRYFQSSNPYDEDPSAVPRYPLEQSRRPGTHRPGHPGVPGGGGRSRRAPCGSWPPRRSGRPSPTSPACSRWPGPPVSGWSTAWPSADPTSSGANRNARLFAAAVALGGDLSPGSRGASLLPELGPEPADLVLARYHGVGPMGGTDLDAVLRNLGVTTIVATGVSVNIAIPSLVMDAVNAAYQVVLPRDAVAGVPREYADQVIDHSLSLLATVTTTRSCWTSGHRRPGRSAHGARGGRRRSSRRWRRGSCRAPRRGGPARRPR